METSALRVETTVLLGALTRFTTRLLILLQVEKARQENLFSGGDDGSSNLDDMKVLATYADVC